MLILFKRILRKSVSSEAVDIEEKLDLEQLIARIHHGDELQREQLITDYKPYILKVTSRFCKRYIDPARDDEYSIALLAFNEAINKFDSDAGKSFLGFAETVMRRRLIDHVRKEQKHALVVPYSWYDTDSEDQSEVNFIEANQALTAYAGEQVDIARRMEIEELNRELDGYGISFMELVELSPKHADSRMMLIGIARILAGDNELMIQLKQTGKLPIKELTALCGVSRKTFERNRKYIISIALILSGTYPYMNDYLQLYDNENDRIGGASV